MSTLNIERPVANQIAVALEGADLTLQFLPSEKEDIKDMVDLINKQTMSSRKILTVESDLREEQTCQELVKKHLDFHGTLDAMYVSWYVRVDQMLTRRIQCP